MRQVRRIPISANAIVEPAGGLLGGIVGGILSTFLEPHVPGLKDVLMAALGATGAEVGKAISAHVIEATSSFSNEDVQRINHHLQSAFQEACDEALIDIGGRICFPDRWTPREMPVATPFDLAALSEGDAELICNVLRQISRAATLETGGPFPLLPPANAPLASSYTLIDRTDLRSLDRQPDLERLAEEFVDTTVTPWLEEQFPSLLGRVPGATTDELKAMSALLAHLRRHLLPRALTHFNERLKSPERTEAWRAFNRLVLEDVRALSRQLIEGQARLEQGQLAAAQRLDALLGSIDGDALSRFAKGASEIIEALGQADRNTQRSLTDMLDLLVEQNTELQNTQRSLSAIDLRTIAILSHIEQIQQRLGRLADSWDAAALVPGRLPWEIPDEFRDERFCPYPGLESFTEQHAAYFFGRADDISRFFTAFLPTHVGNLIGVTSRDSGIGKSSFVAAGLLPAFQRAAAAAGAPFHLLTYTMSSRADLLADFADTIATKIGASPVALLEALRHDESALLAAFKPLLTTPDARILLVLDQFEELFASSEPVASRDCRALLDQLVTINNSASAAITVLIAGRQNFYGHTDFTDRDALVVQLDERRFELGGLKDVQLRRAIEGPLQAFYEEHRQVVRIKEDLIGPLLRDFLDVPGLKQGALPLLQFLLRLLWVEHGRLDYDTYDALGRLSNVFSKYAGNVYARLSADVRQERVADAILIGLVQPGPEPDNPAERRPLIRRRLSLRSEVVDDPARPEVGVVLKMLNDSGRIITQRSSPPGTVAYELTHEVLLESWRLLRDFQEGERRSVIAQRERLLPFAEQWRREGDPVYLYRGSQLTEAESYLNRLTAEPVLDDAIRACYQASLEQRKRERRKNWFRFGIGLLAAVALAVIASLVLNASLRAQVGSASAAQAAAERQAAEQGNLRESLALAASSRTAKGAGEDEAAILLALEAALREDTSTTNAVLRDALSGTGWQPTTLDFDPGSGSRSATWSPDGRSILLVTSEQMLLLNADGTVRHTCAARRVEEIAWRPDGDAFASAGRDGLITVRSAVDCADTATLRGHGGAITRLSWSNDGNLLLSGAEDSTVRIWEIATGREIRQLPADDRYVRAVELSPMKDRLLVATNNSIQVWGMIEGPPLLTIPGTFAFDARWTVGGEGILVDDKVKTTLYDSRSGAALASFAGSGSVATTRIPRIALSPDGERLATLDGTTLRLWEVEGGRAVIQMTGVRDETSQIEWSLDGRLLLTAGGNAMQLWDANTGTELVTLPIADSLISLSPDGKTIITAGLNASDIRLWRSLSTVARVSTAEHPGTVRGGVWSPNGRLIATWSESAAFVWDALSGELVRSLPVADKIADLRWSPQGERILVEDGGVLLLYDAFGDGKPFPLLNLDDNYGTAGRWSGDGARLLALTNSGISSWDATTGAFLQTTPLGSANASLVELSPDGTLAVVVDDGKLVRVIRVADGGEVIRLAIHLVGRTKVDGVTWSPDGRRLAIESSSTATIWRVSDGVQLATLDGDVGYHSLTWSRDGTRILATDGQSLAEFWDVQSGQVATTFSGNKDRLGVARWSPDERRILTTAGDGTVRVWPAQGGDASHMIEAETDESGLLLSHWSPDGSRILVVGRSKVATIYVLETTDLLAIGACSVGRELTADEMTRYGVPQPRRFRFAERVCPPTLTWAGNVDSQATPQPTPIPVATLFPAPTALVADLQQAVYSHFNDYGNNRQLERVCREGHGAVVEFQSPASSMFAGGRAILVRRLGRWSVLEGAPERLSDPTARRDEGLPENFSCLDPLRATMIAITPLPAPTLTAAPPTPTITPEALSEEELRRTIRRTVGPLAYAYDVVRVCREGLLAVGLIEPQAGSVGETLVAVVSQEQGGWQQRFLGPPPLVDDQSARIALGLRADSLCLGALFAPWPAASSASATDLQGDVASDLVDITDASATFEEGQLTVVFTLRALPEQVPFNRSSVSEGQGEYEYGVYIYTDGRSVAQGSRPPADYLLTAIRIGDGGPQGSSSLQDLLEGLWMEREGNDASYRQAGDAQVFVDVQAGTVTLVSRVPSIAGARLLLVATDSGGGNTLQDDVELLLAPK